MSLITSVIFEKGAAISQRVNYGGSHDALHLECNSAYRLPFSIRVPRGFDLSSITPSSPAHVRWHVAEAKMPGRKSAGLRHVLQPMKTVQVKISPTNPSSREPGRRLVIRRIYKAVEEDLYIPESWPPVSADPLIVASFTADRRGWTVYAVFEEEGDADLR